MKLFIKNITYLFLLIFSFVLFLTGYSLCFLTHQSNAMDRYHTSSYVTVDEIFDSENKVFNVTNLNTLLKYISGNSSASISNMTIIEQMASSTTSDGVAGTSARTFRGNTYGKTAYQDIVVTLGGLTWTPVFLSKDTSGDTILTLWLSDNYQSEWEDKKVTNHLYNFYSGGMFAIWSIDGYNRFDVNYPTNMYGTSLMRSIVLNNGGVYATSTTTLSDYQQSSDHVFAKFTMPEYGLTEFLDTPSQIEWQLKQDSSQKFGGNFDVTEPNESSGPLDLYNWNDDSDTNGYVSSMLEGESANYYFAWANDYLWLPSVTEAGLSGNDFFDGLWQISTIQRQTYDSSVAYFNNNGVTYISYMYMAGQLFYASPVSWYRTGGGRNAYNAWCSFGNGTGGNIYPANGLPAMGEDGYNQYRYYARAVRPALHLNLTKATISQYTLLMKDGDVNKFQINNVSPNDKIQLSNYILSKDGYSFKGWNYAGVTYATNETFIVPLLKNGNTTIELSAVWEANTYTIKFNANGGSGSMSDLPMTYDVAESLTANAFTRTGYQFSGWHTDASATTKKYEDKVSVINLTSENGVIVNLYAIWQANSYTIKFNANGGSGSMSDLSMTYDVAKNLTANAFTKLGYKFLGWNTDASAKSAEYINGESVKNLATGVTGDNTVTLYAIWLDTWANNIDVPEGRGTYDSPYKIASAANLAWISAYCEKTASISKYFIQTNAIDLSGYEWLPIGNSTRYFSGNYNGQGYPITNIKLTAISGVTSTYQGLFGYISSESTTTLQNIYLASGSISGTNYVGGIAGYAKNANILNCTNMVSITSNGQCKGGIVGYATNSQIQGCYNYGDVQGGRGIGGIVGYAQESEISNCYAKGNITGSNSLGGIVGMSPNSTITACAYEGTISGSSYYGAIAGNGNSSITNCYAKAVMNSISTNYGMFNGSGSMNNCVFETGTSASDLVKRCKGSDFSNWIINISGLPMPSGLVWIATGGVKVSSVGQIVTRGYRQV